MSNEIKAASFRLIEEDIQKFRQIADEQGLNQAEMFQSLMNSFEMAKAKGNIKDRAKEIEVFQDTVNNLVNMFINSLAINQTSEERIRETLSLELQTKDKTIADLQEEKEKSKAAAKIADEKTIELEKSVKDLRVSLDKATKELDQKNIIIENQQEQINTLNEIVTEYKSYKDLYKELESTNNTLNTEITNTLHQKSDLESKLKNIENMKEFYKNEVDILKVEIKDLNNNLKEIDKSNKEEMRSIELAHKNEIKAIEIAYKQELKELASTNKVEMLNLKEDLTSSFKEELNNKLEVEKSKHQTELDRAINKEQSLKEKYEALKIEYEKQIIENKKVIGSKTKTE